MDKQIAKVERRVRGYWYVDGSYELHLGLTTLIMAVYSFLQVKLNGSGLGNLLILFLGILLVGGGGALVDRLIRALKEGVTFRRSGYVSMRKEKSQPYPPDILILVVFLVVIMGAILFDWLDNFIPAKWLPVLPGLVLAAATGITALRTSQARFYILAAVALLAGIALAIIDNRQWDVRVNGGLYFALMSLVLLVMGAYTLWKYLRKNPLPAESSDEQ
jgi:hypothetical protein